MVVCASVGPALVVYARGSTGSSRVRAVEGDNMHGTLARKRVQPIDRYEVEVPYSRAQIRPFDQSPLDGPVHQARPRALSAKSTNATTRADVVFV